MKILRILLMVIVIVVASFLNGCNYNFIVPEEVPVIDPDDPNAPQISFATDIIPIWNNNNNCTSCHKTGSQVPDLTAANAYAAINSTRYLNSTTPEESRIYKYPHPDTGTHTKKYNNAQAALLLAWIQQGAKNN